MLALLASLGAAGCSRPPMPSASANWISSSSANNTRRFPMSKWCSSRRAREALPQMESSSLRILGACRGPCIPSSSKCLPLAWDHVSHGGPIMAPTTYRLFTALSQKLLTSGRETSPHMGSTTMSTEMVWIVVPSCACWITSTKCWKSPSLLLPEKAWIT